MTPAAIRALARLLADKGIRTIADFRAAYPGKLVREVRL